MSDFVSHVCLQSFPVSRICNNDLLDANRTPTETPTGRQLNLVAPPDSAVPSLDFEQINVF